MKDGLIGVIRKNADKVRFHTPSHAGRLYGNIAEWDVTELNYTDNLLSPSSYLSALEKNIASAYGAEACFISAQGATGSVFQAVFATKNDGAFLVVGKTHCSVFNETFRFTNFASFFCAILIFRGKVPSFFACRVSR